MGQGSESLEDEVTGGGPQDEVEDFDTTDTRVSRPTDPLMSEGPVVKRWLTGHVLTLSRPAQSRPTPRGIRGPEGHLSPTSTGTPYRTVARSEPEERKGQDEGRGSGQRGASRGKYLVSGHPESSPKGPL